jgi:hypothetical protein
MSYLTELFRFNDNLTYSLVGENGGLLTPNGNMIWLPSGGDFGAYSFEGNSFLQVSPLTRKLFKLKISLLG